MIGAKAPVEPRVSLDFQERRRLFRGVAGSVPADLEQRAMRAIRRRERLKKRIDNRAEQAKLRADAVKRRIARQQLAARYARDRRAAQASTSASG